MLTAVIVALSAGCLASTLLALEAARAKRLEQNVASRLIPFLKQNPELLKLPPDKVVALLRKDFYSLNPEEVKAARKALGKLAAVPQPFAVRTMPAPADPTAGGPERGAESYASFAPSMFGD